MEIIQDESRKNREQQERLENKRMKQAQDEASKAHDATLKLAEAQRYSAQLNADAQRESALLIAESNINYDDARRHGANYMNSGYENGNPVKVRFSHDEQGVVTWRYNDPYSRSLLNQAFGEGLKQAMGGVSNSRRQYMLDQAEAAGSELLDRFYIPAENPGGYDIRSQDYCAVYTRILNEQDGTVAYKSNEPFSDGGMNEAFSRGVSKAATAENSPEKCTERLATEVPRIQRARRNKALFQVAVAAAIVAVPCRGTSVSERRKFGQLL